MECLLTDSAFSPNDCFVPAHKKPRGHELNEEQNLFNDLLKKTAQDPSIALGFLKADFHFSSL